MSQPYNGIEEWFEVGKELVVVNNEDEAIETYQRLLCSDEECQKLGENARERVFKDHTYYNRAACVSKILRDCDVYLEICGEQAYPKIDGRVLGSI